MRTNVHIVALDKEKEMAKMTLVVPKEARGIVTMAEAIDAVRKGFLEWGEDPQINAPRRRIHIPTGVRVSVHQVGFLAQMLPV